MKSFALSRLGIGTALLVLSLGAVACGGAATPSGPEAAPPTPVAQLRAMGTTWENAPEPELNGVGGIPPADLTATVKLGGVLNVGGGGATRLDPHFSSSSASERWTSKTWNIGLLTWDLKCNCPAPELAESWEMAQDGLSYTFKLRKDVKFHNKPPVNGRLVTVEDVKWSYERATDLEKKTPGKLPRMRASFLNVKDFQAVDANTFRINMKQKDANILRHVMFEFMVILPKEAAINGDYEETKAMIGAGPFMVELGVNTGVSKFVKNPDYYIKGRPYLDSVTTLAGANASTTMAAMKSKQVDWVTPVYLDAKPLFGSADFRIYNTKGTGVGNGGLYMNANNKPFNDVKVRRAVNLAIDRYEAFEIGYGGDLGMYPWGMIGSWEPWHWSTAKIEGLPGFTRDLTKKKAEVEEAKKLMAESGYASGFTVVCECETPDYAENLAKQLKRIGITMDINLQAGSARQSTEYMKDKTIQLNTIGGGHTPDWGIINAFLCASPTNISNFCDEEIERLYKLQSAEFDEKARIEIIDKIQTRLWDLMPMASLGRYNKYWISWKYVRGWRNSHYDNTFAHSSDLINIWMDK